MADLIQLRRDLAANWTAENPTLAQGEIGLELDSGKYKVGDGSTAWATLAYYTGHGSVSITELGYLDGVTSAIQTQLNGKQATITGGATTITGSDLTASRALVSDSSGKVAVSSVVSTTELDYLDGVTSSVQNQLNGKQNFHGFPNSPYEVVLSYSAANRQITLTPVGSTFDIWLSGVKHTKTGAQTSPAHANTTGNYFIVYGADGNLAVSSDPWDIIGAGIPVCYVYYNATLVDGIPLFELHTAKRNPAWHKSQHFALGTYIRSGLEVADYTLNSAVDASLTYSIASGIIVDEDIEMTLTALADGGPYTIMRRTGASEWTWTTNNNFPYLFTTNGYIQYNQNNGGSYQMTEAASARWVNYFVFATTAIPHTLTNGAPVSSSVDRFLIVPSQTIHTTLAAAQGESIASLSWGGILIPEIVGAWKWTYETKNTNNSTGKVQAVEVSRLTLTRSQLSGNFTAGSHNALTGRDAAESHPASAITNTPAGAIAATDVQAAINELDTEKVAIPTSLAASRIPYGSSTTALTTTANLLWDNTNTRLDVTGTVRASTGVLFGTDTAAANTLDDYEEGTWTPVITDGTNDATMDTSFNRTLGVYTKIGSVVTVFARLWVANIGSVGNALIKGLPFLQGSSVFSSVCVSATNLNITAGHALTGAIYGNADRDKISLHIWNQTTGISSLTGTQISSDGVFHISAVYLA